MPRTFYNINMYGEVTWNEILTNGFTIQMDSGNLRKRLRVVVKPRMVFNTQWKYQNAGVHMAHARLLSSIFYLFSVDVVVA